jgi:flagellar biosynthesis/type III secretory pathway ATPase
MNQQGANLSESQSQQLLQVLVQERQQIQAGTAQNLNSMSPDQAIKALDQQQAMLQQAVSDRVQNILTPEQATTLKGVLSQQLRIGPKTR